MKTWDEMEPLQAGRQAGRQAGSPVGNDFISCAVCCRLQGLHIAAGAGAMDQVCGRSQRHYVDALRWPVLSGSQRLKVGT